MYGIYQRVYFMDFRLWFRRSNAPVPMMNRARQIFFDFWLRFTCKCSSTSLWMLIRDWKLGSLNMELGGNREYYCILSTGLLCQRPIAKEIAYQMGNPYSARDLQNTVRVLSQQLSSSCNWGRVARRKPAVRQMMPWGPVHSIQSHTLQMELTLEKTCENQVSTQGSKNIIILECSNAAKIQAKEGYFSFSILSSMVQMVWWLVLRSKVRKSKKQVRPAFSMRQQPSSTPNKTRKIEAMSWKP